MNRLHTQDPSQASGELAGLFNTIKRSVGKVPAAYATIGTQSPALLAQLLQMNQLLQTNGVLTRKEIEAINLAISEISGCGYCLAAHTLAGKGAGFTPSQMLSLRAGTYPEESKIDALVQFVSHLVRTAGTVPLDVVQNVRAAGYTDRHVVEAIGAVTAILFTNMVNRVNDTDLDFPPADPLLPASIPAETLSVG